MLDPSPAMGADLESGLGDGLRDGWVPLERQRAGEHRDRDLTLPEKSKEAPEADPAAVLVHGLHGQIAGAAGRSPARSLGEADLGAVIAVDHGVLRALLVVDDELEREAGAAGPARIGRPGAVADHVTRMHVHVIPPGFSGRRPSCARAAPPDA